MENIVTRSKFVNETISIVFDFSDQLRPGETISSCTIVVALFTGIDSDPSDILYQIPLIVGNTVDQKFKLGVPGCIYEISFLVIGSLGTRGNKTTELAILPQSGIAIPSFTIIYETSCLYPYEFLDTLTSGVQIVTGSLGYIGLPDPLTSYIALDNCSVVGNLVTYTSGPDSLTSTPLWFLGTVGGAVVSYQVPAENLQANVSWISSSVTGSFISYKIPTENLRSNVVWYSGSVT